MIVSKVILAFTDLQDGDKVYRTTDYFISENEERVAELEGTENKRNTALIKKLTKPELLKLAEKKGIEVEKSAKVGELHEAVGRGLNAGTN